MAKAICNLKHSPTKVPSYFATFHYNVSFFSDFNKMQMSKYHLFVSISFRNLCYAFYHQVINLNIKDSWFFILWSIKLILNLFFQTFFKLNIVHVPCQEKNICSLCERRRSWCQVKIETWFFWSVIVDKSFVTSVFPCLYGRVWLHNNCMWRNCCRTV